MAIRKVRLDKAGIVQCLYCNTYIKYPCSFSKCECENIVLHEDLLTDTKGDHNYKVDTQHFLEVAKKTIITDFDRTLTIGNPYPHIGPPNKKLINHLIRMINIGWRVVVHTCRINPHIVGGKEEAQWHKKQLRKWLDEHGLKLAKICTSLKPYGVIIWEDKAVNPIGNKCVDFLW